MGSAIGQSHPVVIVNERHSLWLLSKYNYRFASILLYCLPPYHSTPHPFILLNSTHYFLLYSPFSRPFSSAPCSFFLSSRDLGVCTQFLLCKSFSRMDECPRPIHHHAYPPPSPLFLYHLAVDLTSDVPVSCFLVPSLFLSPSLFLHLCLLLHPFLGHTATMGELPSTQAVKRL